MKEIKLKSFVSAKYMFKVKYGSIHSTKLYYDSYEVQLCMLRNLAIVRNTLRTYIVFT